MPNIKSAEKRMRTSEKARQRNVEAKSKLKTLRRNLLDGMASGDADQSQAAYRAYSSGLDKAASIGAIGQRRWGQPQWRRARASSPAQS